MVRQAMVHADHEALGAKRHTLPGDVMENVHAENYRLLGNWPFETWQQVTCTC